MFFKNNSSKVHALITEQIKDVEGCLKDFNNFIGGAVKPETDNTTLRALAAGVHNMENAADRSLRAMIDSLNGSAFLPATRSELIEIAASCDKVANKCQHIAHILVWQQFRFPAKYAKQIEEICELSMAQFKVLQDCVRKVFADFGDMLNDHSILDEVREYESKVDAIEETLMEDIYAQEEMRLSERIQIANFVELVCDLSDIMEDVADKIQIMLITRKV